MNSLERIFRNLFATFVLMCVVGALLAPQAGAGHAWSNGAGAQEPTAGNGGENWANVTDWANEADWDSTRDTLLQVKNKSGGVVTSDLIYTVNAIGQRTARNVSGVAIGSAATTWGYDRI